MQGLREVWNGQSATATGAECGPAAVPPVSRRPHRSGKRRRADTGDRSAPCRGRRRTTPASAPAAARVQAVVAGDPLDDATRDPAPLRAPAGRAPGSLAAVSGECAPDPAARWHLGPENPGFPRLLHAGRRPAADPLFAVEGGGQRTPAP